jgi:hypothetical protein
MKIWADNTTASRKANRDGVSYNLEAASSIEDSCYHVKQKRRERNGVLAGV